MSASFASGETEMGANKVAECVLAAIGREVGVAVVIVVDVDDGEERSSCWGGSEGSLLKERKRRKRREGA
jgi:hypothetical protein